MVKCFLRMLDKNYNPEVYEGEIYRTWEKSGCFTPEIHREKKPFTIIMPPPNANGSLHLGHAVFVTIEDIMIRHKRMNGFSTLWLPGSDHAGIQTQVVFERDILGKKRLTRFDLGREKFFEECFKFCEESKSTIYSQFKSMGASCDWTREKFTLDPRISEQVFETFKWLFRDGLVFKGEYLVNWCPRCFTTLSNLETEHKLEKTNLWYIKYPVISKAQKVWRLNFLDDELFELVKSGEKTIETRALNPEEKDRFFGDIKEGDIIVCYNKKTKEAIVKTTKKVSIFRNLDEVFDKIGIRKIFPQKDIVPKESLTCKPSEEQVKDSFYRIYEEKFGKEYVKKINENGIVAIELERFTPKEFVEVVTTRPETMLGDTAVAINPKDERYKNLKDKKVLLPLLEREIEVVFDDLVDEKFGTGAVKVTPAHDPVDYEIGRKHNLKKVTVISKEDEITEEGGKYFQLDKVEAREKVLEDLRKMGLISKIEEYSHEVNVCERCKTKIESIISDEWFIDTKPLIDKVFEILKSGETKIHPKRSEKILYNWMKAYQPWPISRQIWWGHRIPVYYKKKTLEPVEITFVRHGESEQNVPGNIIRNAEHRTNCNLTEKGLEEAKILAEKLRGEKFDAVFCSNTKRTIDTMSEILKTIQVGEIKIDKRIQEMIPKEDFQNVKVLEDGKMDVDWSKFETQDEMIERFKKFLESEMPKFSGGKVLMVSHRAGLFALSKITGEFDYKDFHDKTGSIVKFKYTPKVVDRNDFFISRNGKIETDLILVRHAESENVVLGICSGDPEKDRFNLTKKGKAQSEELSKILEGKKFDAVFYSEMKRAKQTMEIATKNCKVGRFIEDPLLNDVNFGIFEGKNVEEFRKARAEKDDGTRFESFEELKKRAKAFIERIKKEYLGKRVLVFSHVSPLRALVSVLDNLTEDEAKKVSFLEAEPIFKTIECELEGGEEFVQDEDVFDTWFSSAQWPVTTLGGPNPSPDFRYFYPTDVMETGWDILFLWVARMMMLGKYLTGKSPFKNVYLHGLARDRFGEKMSKSKGNGIDPLVMTKKYGTDSLRMALVFGNKTGEDFRIYEEKIESFRNFVNKIWNAGRLLESIFGKISYSEEKFDLKLESSKWILFETRKLLKEIDKKFERFDYGIAGERIRSFSWNLFCDWWLEIIKIESKEGKNFEEIKKVAGIVFGVILKLLHPFAPFFTEVLWQKIFENSKKELLISSAWPNYENFSFVKGSKKQEVLIDVIKSFRYVKKEIFNESDKILLGFSEESQEGLKKFLEKSSSLIEEILKTKIASKEEKKILEKVSYPVNAHLTLELFVDKELKSFSKKIKEKNLEKLKIYKKSLEKKLANKEFVKKAPKNIVLELKQKLEDTNSKIAKMEEIF